MTTHDRHSSQGLTTSVVIRALNEEEHIGRLLTGLHHQTHQADEVIVVDSGSKDATVQIAEQFGAKIVHIEPRKFSFGRSLNYGCRAAQGQLVVIASAHVYPVFDTWVEKLVEPFGDPKVALSYGRQVGDKATKYSEHRVLQRWFPAESNLDQGHPFCNNANAAVRRDVWAQQPYDEQLTGLEDLDWARRAINAGWKIAYVAEAPVVHVHDETWTQVYNRYRREALAHRKIYEEQSLSLPEAVRLAVSNVVSDSIHALGEGVLANNLSDIVRFRFAQFMGTFRGFQQHGPVTQQLKRRFYYPERGTPVTEGDDLTSDGNRIDYGRSIQSGDS